jgi:hypothetical protein
MSPAVIWTAPSPGKADDEGRDCGVACPWTEMETETETDREPCDPAEARMGDGCGSNGVGERWPWACTEDRPSLTVAGEVRSAELEVLGSISARVSRPRGVRTRGGREREGFERRDADAVRGWKSAGMGASRRM